MRALSIRQPYAELILRGIKTVEYRSRPTRIIGERFYIYAARKWADVGAGDQYNCGDLRPGDPELPTGVLVGAAVISHCTASAEPGGFQWHLTGVKRLDPRKQRKPKRRPQPVWFRPF